MDIKHLRNTSRAKMRRGTGVLNARWVIDVPFEKDSMKENKRYPNKQA